MNSKSGRNRNAEGKVSEGESEMEDPDRRESLSKQLYQHLGLSTDFKGAK